MKLLILLFAVALINCVVARSVPERDESPCKFNHQLLSSLHKVLLCKIYMINETSSSCGDKIHFHESTEML